MHPSAFAHMSMCVDTYLDPSKRYQVVDIGSRISSTQQMTHRHLLAGYDCEIVGVDIEDGRNVDRVMKKPYRIPAKTNSADVVISGQAFEHIPFFWVTFLEMARVVRPGGMIFLTAPSRGHIHTEQDCWRFYPDGMRALAAFSRMKLKEAHTDFPPNRPRDPRHVYAEIDDEYYWGDSVAVFQKPKNYSHLVRVAREGMVWWANRVSGIDAVPQPKPRQKRIQVLDSYRTEWRG